MIIWRCLMNSVFDFYSNTWKKDITWTQKWIKSEKEKGKEDINSGILNIANDRYSIFQIDILFFVFFCQFVYLIFKL